MKLFHPYKTSIKCTLNKSAKNDYLKPKCNEIMPNATQPLGSLLISSQPSCHQVAGDNKADPTQDTFFQNEKLSLKLCKRNAKKCNDVQLQEIFDSYKQMHCNGYRVAL